LILSAAVLGAISSDSSLIITLAGAVVVMVLAPITALRVTNSARQRDREAEWAHQEKENRAAAIAEARLNGIAVDDEGTAAEIRAQINKALLDRVQVVADKVDVVHTFVNNDRLVLVKRELASAQRDLVQLRTIVRLTDRLGDAADPEAQGIIAATEKHIADLVLEVDQRQAGSDQAAAQMEARPGGAIGG
jgi:hypothetical protein